MAGNCFSMETSEKLDAALSRLSQISSTHCLGYHQLWWYYYGVVYSKVSFNLVAIIAEHLSQHILSYGKVIQKKETLKPAQSL